MTNSEILIDRWRHLMTTRLATQRRDPQPFAALGFLCRDRPQARFVPLRQVTVVVAHDVVVPHRMMPKLRLAGYGARVNQSGVVWGGADAHRFEKNLSLCPQDGAGGPRLSLRQPELIDAGIRLARRLSYARRHPAYPCRDVPEFPQVWAGFCDEGRIGPEQLRLDGRKQTGELSVEQLFAATAVRHKGLLLIPIDWVAHLRRHVIEYFVDLRYRLARQTIRMTGPPINSLEGRSSGVVFDLWGSRFGGQRKRRTRQADSLLDRRLAVA